jgi:galactokinase
MVPIPDDVRLVIWNTLVKHDHAGGEYNRRRDECNEGVRVLSRWYPEIRALRDVTLEQSIDTSPISAPMFTRDADTSSTKISACSTAARRSKAGISIALAN